MVLHEYDKCVPMNAFEYLGNAIECIVIMQDHTIANSCNIKKAMVIKKCDKFYKGYMHGI